jgi:hypothetical protein
MGLFRSTAKLLATRPAVLFPTDPADAMADALTSYDPEFGVRSDRFVLGNGVLLYGPVEVTPELAGKAGLPGGMTAAYYASIAIQASAERRPDDDKWQDAERLVRGLAARLGGTVHGQRPAMDLTLDASVYSGQQLPVEDVIAVLRPFAGGRELQPGPLRLEGAYALRPMEGSILFLTMYWPPWVSGMKLDPPPPAIGELRRRKPCRWELHTSVPVRDATPEVCQTVGGAALALASRTGGVVVDTYGFPVSRPEDLLPG